MPSLSILKHTPHRAYWVEQQTRVGGTQGDGILVGGGMGKLEVAGGLWVERQAGWLGVLGLEAAGGPFQLWAELGSLGHLCLLLPLQLPLPLMELMENEALEILTKALRSEPLPSSHKRPWGILQGLAPWEWGFKMCLPCQIPLKYSRSPTKNKKLGDWAQRHQVGRSWGDCQGSGLQPF